MTPTDIDTAHRLLKTRSEILFSLSCYKTRENDQFSQHKFAGGFILSSRDNAELITLMHNTAVTALARCLLDVDRKLADLGVSFPEDEPEEVAA